MRPIKGMGTRSFLLKLLAKRKYARNSFYGHSHEWQHDRQDHLHLINESAVSYYYGKDHANGWVDLKLTAKSANLKLCCIDSKHPQHGDRVRNGLKGKRNLLHTPVERFPKFLAALVFTVYIDKL